MNRFWILSLAIALLFSACKKGEDPGKLIAAEPEIGLISFSPAAVQEFVDELRFEISYRDGDGDLGSNVATDKNLFILDSRIGVTHSFRLQQLAPDTGTPVPITGSFTAILPNTLITDGSASQSVTFEIWVRDRAGNESNHVQAGPITVGK